MKERKLLLLGLLLTQSRHGYQINDFIEKNLAACIEIKRSTAYSTLDNLCAAGYVHMDVEQNGNRPPRKVYTLTAKGRKLFDRLLKESLTKLEGHTTPFETALLYIDAVQPHERLTLLERRKELLGQAISELESVPSHGEGSGVNFSISHRLYVMRAELEWLTMEIERSTGT